jgi:hypothetical protein
MLNVQSAAAIAKHIRHAGERPQHCLPIGSRQVAGRDSGSLTGTGTGTGTGPGGRAQCGGQDGSGAQALAPEADDRIGVDSATDVVARIEWVLHNGKERKDSEEGEE